MLINSPDRNQTANLWKVIIIQMRDRKKGNPIQKTLHIITAENFRWIKQKHAAAFSLNTVTCCACDMATPWPPSTSGPSWVGVKRYWRLPKTDLNSEPPFSFRKYYCRTTQVIPCFSVFDQLSEIWPQPLHMDSELGYNPCSSLLVHTREFHQTANKTDLNQRYSVNIIQWP